MTPTTPKADAPEGTSAGQADVWTYAHQPCDNVVCWRLGEACRKAAEEPKCGDYIDRGLILLRELQAQGFGIVPLAQPTKDSHENQRL